MRAPHYKTYSLADLEWLVPPPLLTGPFAVVTALGPFALRPESGALTSAAIKNRTARNASGAADA